MLALCHTLLAEKLHDREFLDRCTVGFEKFAPYARRGKDAGMGREDHRHSRASRIAALAREMAATRTMVNINWSLQRSHHGEQPFWALVTLACMLGQIGLPGGGFGARLRPGQHRWAAHARTFSGPTLPQGTNAVTRLHPGRALHRHAAQSRRQGTATTASDLTYPDIRLVYWAGGNPFHHHQDLNRLCVAWRKPETIVFHEQFWTPAAQHGRHRAARDHHARARRHRLGRARAAT